MPDPLPDTRRIVVFGDVIDDIVVVPSGDVRVDTDTPAAISRSAGGSAANAAAWLGSLGTAVDFVGMVGRDDVVRHGHALASVGVTPHLEGHPNLPTGTIVLLVDGEHRTMLTETGANAKLTPDSVTDELLDAASLVHFTGYSLFGRPDQLALRELFDRAATRDVEVSVDPASVGFIADMGVGEFLDAISGASLLFPNLEEGRLLSGFIEPDDVILRLAEWFPLVALTLDSDGVLVAQRGRSVEFVEATRVDVAEPTGAGDAFAAGFLSSWIVDRDGVAAARAGAAAGARAVSAIGGRPPA